MSPLSNYATLVFDCDGVVLNSNRIKTDAFRAAASSYGEDAARALTAHHVAHGGVSRYKKFQYFLSNIVPDREGPGLDALLASYAEHVRAGLARCEVAPGLDALRCATDQAGWMIASGGDQNELRALFRDRGLHTYFDRGVFGSPDPKSRILSRELETGNLRAPALFLGDSVYDYEAAREFDLDFVFIYGWTEVHDWQSFVHANRLPATQNLQTLLTAG